MAHEMAQNNGNWGALPPHSEGRGPEIRPMGLKVHYTFDKDSQERCLARWPRIINVQTIPMEGQTIGIVDLGLCLHTVSQCSPELAGDDDRDYAVYAFDYSEPDTPLVGQGLLSRGLNPGFEPQEPKLVTGRVSKNLLAIFGNGIKETLEVRLKLTAISKISRVDFNQRPHSATATPLPPNLHASSSSLSENGEWGSFVQNHPGLGQRQPAQPVNPTTFAPAPIRPYSSSLEPKHDTQPHQHYPPLQPAPSSRPGSVDPNVRERDPSSSNPASLNMTRQSPAGGEVTPNPPATKITKPQPQSRPNSRASSRPPTGRPRGRPRKRPLASEGNTSGYEDGTDGDDVPSRTKKRATITQVERSNTTIFGSAPESLRVAASTSGSIRNFRPVAPNGDHSGKGHLQPEGPRAPTPVPGPRFQGQLQPKTVVETNLRRQTSIFQPVEDLSNPTYPDLNRSMSQDARSPGESMAPSPFSDEASPADISSSPPVPRSAMYSMRSSPAPSSPILPPMRGPAQEPDSGFMSGGIDDTRAEDDFARKSAPIRAPAASAVAKPKPRRSRAKKQPQAPQQSLHIHTEVPGPPELLPQTSIYNPPRSQGPTKKSMASTPVAAESLPDNPATLPQPAPIPTPAPAPAPAPVDLGTTDEQKTYDHEETPASLPPEMDYAALEAALSEFSNQHRFLNTMNTDGNAFSPADNITPENDGLVDTFREGKMEPPVFPPSVSEPSVEPELVAIPASDPVLPQLPKSAPVSVGQHPQTDAPESTETRMNKNYVKRQAIKQKLEEAVASGQMPSFCNNCGALQTPTWRKIWKQECRGVPAYHEYSEKPGYVTAINVLERDDGGTPVSYEVIKKSLGPLDDKSLWSETLLCNPCGIWFSKWKAHRPPEKWEKDEQRLTQTRKKRSTAGGGSRLRKARTKSDSQMLTSEACVPTDPAGPPDAPTPKESAVMKGSQAENGSEEDSGRSRKRTAAPKDRGSTHSRASRASGTAMSPIDLDEELGATRRLLFPSPRKDGEHKVLGEVAVNIVQTGPKVVEIKEGEVKEKSGYHRAKTPEPIDNDFADLFGSIPRPSTPPPAGLHCGPFKTPTRPTPSHRPVTRSVSKSMRSSGSLASPSRALLERTPTRTPRRTPRSAHRYTSLPRRSPRHQQLPSEAMGDNHLTTPLTRSIANMFSDTDHLIHSPSRGFEIDFASLPHIDNIDQQDTLSHFDFSTLMATDAIMPSSPPLRDGDLLVFGGNLEFELETQQFEFQPSPRAKDGRTDSRTLTSPDKANMSR
ncbi:hypothetical protein F5Y17DRAFT_393526 [Xylariaceae sp. FL0594]|nr:hypothetical protein F5Y17DRAFT_393526 [Xylariaceae sp. FL0594]